MCGCAARFRAIAAPHASGHCYFALKDDKAKIEAVIWKGDFRAAAGSSPKRAWRSSSRAASRRFPGSSKYQIVIEALEPAGARRADGAARGTQAQVRRRRPVRGGAQEAAAVPAESRRHRHLADRRRHPRHAARLQRALSDARAALAGARTRRRQRRRSGSRDPRLQRACKRAEKFRGPTC